MKNLSVPGDGGFLTTNNKKIFEKVLLLRDHGRVKKEINKSLSAVSIVDSIICMLV